MGDNRVLKGETPFINFTTQDKNGNTLELGQLWCKGGTFSFTGSVDMSGKAFFDNLVGMLNEHIEEHLGNDAS